MVSVRESLHLRHAAATLLKLKDIKRTKKRYKNKIRIYNNRILYIIVRKQNKNSRRYYLHVYIIETVIEAIGFRITPGNCSPAITE
jgi:hypothetical protein